MFLVTHGAALHGASKMKSQFGTPSEKLYTKQEVARWAHCTPRCIDLWVRQGKLPEPIKIGARPLWKESDLLKLVGTTTRTNSA